MAAKLCFSVENFSQKICRSIIIKMNILLNGKCKKIGKLFFKTFQSIGYLLGLKTPYDHLFFFFWGERVCILGTWNNTNDEV